MLNKLIFSRFYNIYQLNNMCVKAHTHVSFFRGRPSSMIIRITDILGLEVNIRVASSFGIYIVPVSNPQTNEKTLPGNVFERCRRKTLAAGFCFRKGNVPFRSRAAALFSQGIYSRVRLNLYFAVLLSTPRISPLNFAPVQKRSSLSVFDYD